MNSFNPKVVDERMMAAKDGAFALLGHSGISRRHFLGQLGVLGAGLSGHAAQAFADAGKTDWAVPVALQSAMYRAAIELAKKKIRGGPHDPVYKKPFLDAAFSGSIFLWDTCFIASYAKYHQIELPIANALDNFYALQEADGYICREYTREGRPFWPKDHPVSINPPLLAFAELELYGQSGNRRRLKKAYPHLMANFRYLVARYRMADGLFFNDAFGSGMDNIPRYPDGWRDDGKGIPLRNLYPDLFTYEGLSPHWNRQGRGVDISAQMALLADNLIEIANRIGETGDVVALREFHTQTKDAINRHCWNEADGFYYDLGYGEQIRRKHIGMFWVLIAGVAPVERQQRLLAHLTDPNQFWRRFPLASYPADQPGFSAAGGYWLGSVWAPTNYMVIRGLVRCGQNALAGALARQYYWCVAEVYKNTGTFWENYAPDTIQQGSQSRADFCGWTALAPIALHHEFIRTP